MGVSLQTLRTPWDLRSSIRSCKSHLSPINVLACTVVDRASGRATLYITEDFGLNWLTVATDAHEFLWADTDTLLVVHKADWNATDAARNYRISRYAVRSRTLLPALEHAWNLVVSPSSPSVAVSLLAADRHRRALASFYLLRRYLTAVLYWLAHLRAAQRKPGPQP
jgi:hypothetical protein